MVLQNMMEPVMLIAVKTKLATVVPVEVPQPMVRLAKDLVGIEVDITLAVAEEATMEALQDKEDHLEPILPLQVLPKPLDKILAMAKQQ